MNRKPGFTIYHGLIVSLILHASLSMPFVLHSLASPTDEPPTLVVELQGAVASGQIRPESLKVVSSSGQATLDASAMQTIRSSVPFDAPPKEMTIAIAVAFSRKR